MNQESTDPPSDEMLMKLTTVDPIALPRRPRGA